MRKSRDESGRTGGSFWTTLPGLLTGCAAIITAAGGLITIVVTVWPNLFSNTPPTAAPTIAPAPTVIIIPTQTPGPPTESPTPVPAIDVSGSWLGANGLQYNITQNGSLLQIQEIHPVFGITAEGQGTIHGTSIDISYRSLDGSFGRAQLTLLEDGTQLTGTFTNQTMNISTPASLFKQ